MPVRLAGLLASSRSYQLTRADVAREQTEK